MIPCRDFFGMLAAEGVTFFTGVPDSLLKQICAYITDNVPAERHVIAANEGNALALASGHQLATGELPLVYLQNSGQGNLVNPLTSLTDPQVYGIPLLLLVGWRGAPGVSDEPQHRTQGQVTVPLFNTLGVSCETLPTDSAAAGACVSRAAAEARRTSAPYALVVSKNTFEPYALRQKRQSSYALTREQALGLLLEGLAPTDIVVSTTGKTSRELFELREQRGEGHERDFLTVGSMGHASSIALGIALARPDRRVWCIDGDGAALMHLGSMALLGARRPRNFFHVLINNGAHESVGGQATVGFDVDFAAIARGCGYPASHRIEDGTELAQRLTESRDSDGPLLLEVRVRTGSRDDLGRPTSTPAENKRQFQRFVRTCPES